jgi:hypothetical protein
MSNIHKEELLERAKGNYNNLPADSNSLSEKARTENGFKFLAQNEEPKGFSNMHKVKQYTTNQVSNHHILKNQGESMMSPQYGVSIMKNTTSKFDIKKH